MHNPLKVIRQPLKFLLIGRSYAGKTSMHSIIMGNHWVYNRPGQEGASENIDIKLWDIGGSMPMKFFMQDRVREQMDV
jgi:GTPase SAR1 family protein